MAIADQQVHNAITTICIQVLDTLQFKEKEMIDYVYDKTGDLVSIEYNTKVLNAMLNDALKTIDSSLTAAQIGEADPLLNEIFFKDGVIYELPVGYLTRIAFLQDKGWKIKISMRIYHSITGSILVKSTPYGLNSSMIQVILRIKIKAKTIASIYNDDIEVKQDIILLMQLVQGKIPSYTTPLITQEKKNSR